MCEHSIPMCAACWVAATEKLRTPTPAAADARGAPGEDADDEWPAPEGERCVAMTGAGYRCARRDGHDGVHITQSGTTSWRTPTPPITLAEALRERDDLARSLAGVGALAQRAMEERDALRAELTAARAAREDSARLDWLAGKQLPFRVVMAAWKATKNAECSHDEWLAAVRVALDAEIALDAARAGEAGDA